jgi:hypothetical protein
MLQKRQKIGNNRGIKIKKILLLCMFISFKSYAFITDASLIQASPMDEWQTLETENFSINYKKEYFPYAQRTAFIAQKIHKKLIKKVQWTPKEKTQIVLLDSVDFVNGGATPLPQNTIVVYMNASNKGELLDHTSWLELLLTHEYTHILHIDQVTGAPKTIRNILGKGAGLFTVFTLPQMFAPHWLSEGYAVYVESSKGLGRSNNAVFESKMRQEVINGLKTYSQVSYEGYNASRWPFGLVYLYGAYFFKFIEETYGEKKLTHYITNYNKNLIPWKMDSRARRTFNKGAVELWAEYQQYLKTRFAPQIAKIKANKQDTKLIVDDVFQNSFITKGPNNSIIYYANNAISSPEIKQIFADSTQKTLLKLSGITDLDWDEKQGLLITRLGICNNTNLYSDVYQFDLKEKKLTQLSDCQRLSEAIWSKHQGFYAIKNEGSKQTLVKVVDKKITTLFKFELGDVIGAFDVSKDDMKIIASVKREKTGWNLEMLNLQNKQWQQITKSQYKERNPKFDQNFIYYVADNKTQQQVELYRLNLNTDTKEQLTNSLGFVINFVVVKEGVLLQYYNAKNEQIHYLKNMKIFEQSNNAQPQKELNLITNKKDFKPENIIDDAKEYSAFDTLAPTSWLPFLSASEYESEVGVLIEGNDVLGFHHWLLAPTYYYDKALEKVGGVFSYDFYNRINLFAKKEIQVYLEGNEDDAQIKSFDEITTQQVLINYPINKLDWSLDFKLGMANQKVENNVINSATITQTNDTISGAMLSFNNLSFHNHSISLTEGFKLDLTTEKYTDDSYYQGSAEIMNLSAYIPIIKKQVIKISALYAQGDETIEPFQLGGAYNLLSSIGDGQIFGRRSYALRGYQRISALQGTRITRTNIAYNFPIATIYDGWSIFPVGVGDIHANIFYESGSAWYEGDEEKTQYNSIGAQFTFDLMIGFDTFSLPITMGVAKGLDKELGETQAYLKLGFEF